jgi:type IV secretory pathway TraG/TraD family ATPase VirD4
MDGSRTLQAAILDWTSGVRGVVVALGLLLIVATVFLIRRTVSQDVHKRGTRIVAAAGRWRQRFYLFSEHNLLTLAGVRVTPLDETKHFKLIGTTGTGKSTAIRELLRCALERGDRAVIADPDGGYLRSFYDRYRGDIVLNPFEKGAVKWDLFAEIRERYDIDQLASGLIPTTEDATGQEWRGYARTFMSAVIRRCHEQGPRDVAEFWRLLAVAPSSELRPVVFDTPAQPFLEPDNARMFGSIRSVAGSAAAALAYIKQQRAQPFSVRNWVESGQGVLFIPYKAAQIAALRSIIATWIRLAIVEAMSHPEEDQHLWFVVDELDALGAIDGLKDALARLRKFGCRCVLGFQSIAQVSSTYGPGEAQTIIENCGNTLILRCSGSENGGTSQFASRLIGEREVIRRQTSRGRDREGLFVSRGSRRSTSVSEQHVTEAAVMASELEQLPDLTGYLKTASGAAWLRVAFSR